MFLVNLTGLILFTIYVVCCSEPGLPGRWGGGAKSLKYK